MIQNKINLSVLSLVSFSGLILSLVHEILTELYPPFDGLFDIAMHIVLITLKISVIILFAVGLKEIFAFIHQNKRNAVLYFITLYLLFTLLFFLHITFTRDLFCSLASNDTIKYFYLSDPNLKDPMYIGGAKWAEEWPKFIPQLKELLLGFIFSLTLTTSGYYFSQRLKTRITIAAGLLMIITIIPATIGLSNWDYDFFMGGVFFDVLSIELFPFFWFMIGTQTIITFSLIFCFYLHGYIFVRYLKPRAPLREH